MLAVVAADPIRVIEAAYRWAEHDCDWLAGIVEAVAPFGIGTGAAAYRVEVGRSPSVRAFVGDGVTDAFERSIVAFTRAMSTDTAHAVYAPTEFVGNAMFRLRRVAEARGSTPEALTAGNAIAAWALVGGDVRRIAITIVFPAAANSRFDANRGFPNSRLLGLAAAHLGAAARLRDAAAPLSPDDAATESVLSPRGKVLHATGEACTRASRESLVEAVSRRARARGSLRRADPEEATELWSALVDGRWSIVDVIDRDGKHLLLARKNTVPGIDLIALDDDERAVVWLITQGHSLKYVAYELGRSLGQVTRRLKSALRKLRLRSRRELMRKFSRHS